MNINEKDDKVHQRHRSVTELLSKPRGSPTKTESQDGGAASHQQQANFQYFSMVMDLKGKGQAERD